MVESGVDTERDVGGAGARPATRDAELDAALATFTEQTYGGTRVALVAERAGVAVGSIYRHFPSKEALGNAVYRRWKSRLLGYLTRDAGSDEPVRESFGRMWRALLAFATDHPEAFGFLECQQHEGYLDADSVALSGGVEAIGVGLIERGQRAGEVRTGDPTVLLALVYGAFVGLCKRHLDGPPLGPADIDAAEAAVWDLLRPHS
jgi:AcrR family transcriptional regulator